MESHFRYIIYHVNNMTYNIIFFKTNAHFLRVFLVASNRGQSLHSPNVLKEVTGKLTVVY